jgi:hypothetical protein
MSEDFIEAEGFNFNTDAVDISDKVKIKIDANDLFGNVQTVYKDIYSQPEFYKDTDGFQRVKYKNEEGNELDKIVPNQAIFTTDENGSPVIKKVDGEGNISEDYISSNVEFFDIDDPETGSRIKKAKYFGSDGKLHEIEIEKTIEVEVEKIVTQTISHDPNVRIENGFVKYSVKAEDGTEDEVEISLEEYVKGHETIKNKDGSYTVTAPNGNRLDLINNQITTTLKDGSKFTSNLVFNEDGKLLINGIFTTDEEGKETGINVDFDRINDGDPLYAKSHGEDVTYVKDLSWTEWVYENKLPIVITAVVGAPLIYGAANYIISKIATKYFIAGAVEAVTYHISQDDETMPNEEDLSGFRFVVLFGRTVMTVGEFLQFNSEVRGFYEDGVDPNEAASGIMGLLDGGEGHS